MRRIILSQTWSALAAELDLETGHEDEEELPASDCAVSQSVRDAMSLRESLLIFLTVGLPALALAYLLLRQWSDR